jgi:GNAT superfamily N-acetyltransferase
MIHYTYKVGGILIQVEMIETMEQFFDHTQIILLLKDQMEYIGSPKSNDELLKTITLALKTDSAHLMVISENGNTLGFAFFNIAIGMESSGKYLWLNEMHIHKDYRSKGYGAVLIDKMKEWCKENKVVRIMGMADESEKRTLQFYQKQGAETYSQDIISIKL